MSESTVRVSTPRGTMPVYVHEPDGLEIAPLVVLLMDAPGVRPALHGHADRLVRAGYRVAIPDLYYMMSDSDRPDVALLAAGNTEEFARMGGVVAHVIDEEVLVDMGLLLDELLEAEERFGCVGFCMGGRLGLRSAQRFGERLAAASLLHPSGLVTERPDSPHLDLGAVTGSLYLGFGENDHVTPLSAIPPLERELGRQQASFEIEVLRGADHGFTMPDLPPYNPAAAEQAWAGTLALLTERLPGKL